MKYKPDRIISGGQTGADRAGLDWAIENGIKHGGFCPKGRKAEDGVIPAKYGLIQSPTSDPRERTQMNVKTGDATLIFIGKTMGPGSRQTELMCKEEGKPYLVVDASTSTDQVAGFLNQHQPKRLNVAGSRASKDPAVYQRVKRVLDAVLGPSPQPVPEDQTK